jgi:hypothetical protein
MPLLKGKKNIGKNIKELELDNKKSGKAKVIMAKLEVRNKSLLSLYQRLVYLKRNLIRNNK